MRRFKAVAVIAVIVSLALRAANAPALEVTYLGNEGFLVRSGSQVVLFDALFGEGLPDYDRVPPEVVRDMEIGHPPFANVNVVFISHVHPDHFDLPSTVRFLKAHPLTAVVAPTEVSQQLRKALAGKAGKASQIRTVSAQSGQIITCYEGGIQIGVFPLPHGNVENLAYLVVLHGRTVLHVGDADIPMKALAGLKLFDHRIDLAFIPFWQLTENAEAVRDQIGANVVVPMHLITHATTADTKEYLEHIGGYAGLLAKIRSEFPNAEVFRTPLETRRF